MTVTTLPAKTLPTVQEILKRGPKTEDERVLFPKMKSLLIEVSRQAGTIGALQRQIRRGETPLRYDSSAILRDGLGEARRINGNLTADNRALRNRNRRLRNRIGDLEMAMGKRSTYQPRVLRVRVVG